MFPKQGRRLDRIERFLQNQSLGDFGHIAANSGMTTGQQKKHREN